MKNMIGMRARLALRYALLAPMWALTLSGQRGTAPRCAAEFAPADTLRYVFLVGPLRPIGSAKIWRDADGALRFVEESKSISRGYAPRTTARVEGRVCLGSDAFPIALSVERSTGGGLSMRESFERVGTSVRVTVRGTTTTKRMDRDVFFAPSASSHVLTALAIRAAMTRPSNTLRVPDGREIRVRELTTTTLPGARAVKLYEALWTSGHRDRVWLDRKSVV